MRVPDLNVLVYAQDSSSTHHEAARAWIERRLSGIETVGFAFTCILGFIRLTTNPRLMPLPLAPSEAFDQVEEWLLQAPATLVHPGSRHLRICRELLDRAGTAGNLTTDAHLAALAIEHGAALATFDGDFHRFAELDLEYLA